MTAPSAKTLFGQDVVDRVEELHWFGRFIANTDMHHGNLSFRPEGAAFSLASAYDMLPMAYAPHRGGEVPEIAFPPLALPGPPAGREAAWSRMLDVALVFWAGAAADPRSGQAFRATSAANAEHLHRFRDVWSAAAQH